MQSLQIPISSNKAKVTLASPAINDHTSFESFQPASTNRYRKRSPSPYSDRGNAYADNESDTSGQDEFHLERYSQPAEQSKKRRDNNKRLPNTSFWERTESSRKQLRPGLNIITDFAVVPTRSRTEELVLEQVPKQRPQLARRAVTSVVSQKAENFYQAAQKDVTERTGFVSPNDVNRIVAQSNVRMPFSGRLPTRYERSPASKKSRAARDISAADRSIVIGISLPEDQALHHKMKEASSAISLYTPATPQIVVYSAEEEAPWSEPGLTPRRRPASSIYSHRMHDDRQYQADGDAPPVPFLARSNAFEFVTQTQADPRPNRVSSSGAHHRPVSTDTIFDDHEQVANHDHDQTFADSDDETMPLTGNSARPKSKGWWDLALTPMLSRAGTVFARHSPTESSAVPPVPGKLPQAGTRTLINNNHKEPFLSPETPRDLGMGSGQTSTARWEDQTEREEKPSRAKATAQNSVEEAWEGHKALESSAMVPFMIGALSILNGLSAEYYTACAFDQENTKPYFACQNHSCIEKLPNLGSVHDRSTNQGMLVNQPTLAPESTAARNLALEKLQGDEPATPRALLHDDSRAVQDDPVEFSPNMRSATVGTIMKPATFQPLEPAAARPADRAIDEPEAAASTRNIPPLRETSLPTYYLPPSRPAARLATFGPVTAAEYHPSATSPSPLSPEAQKVIAPRGAVPMSEMQQSRSFEAIPHSIFINNYISHPDVPQRAEQASVSLTNNEKRGGYKSPPQTNENKDKLKKDYLSWLSCIRRKEDDPKKKKRRMCFCLIFLGVLSIVILCIVLAITLTRKGDNTPIDTHWLNLTGYPPMPTGISTVIRPDVLNADDSCVSPSTLWSCAVPKEQVSEIAPNDPDQPNFRFEIRFHNDTSGVSPADTIPLNGTGTAVAAQDPFTNDLFTPNPGPPSVKEQIFLGNTTDNVAAPFDGEITPFFITLITAFPVVPPGFQSTASRLVRRQSSNNSLTLPPPSTTSNNAPAPAQLLPQSPFPSSQPLRLYNRGLASEHYGFYTYYDKTIFLSTNSVINNTDKSSGVLADDQNGGSFASSADAMCTFSQTRFLVKIFTNPSSGLSLLPLSTSSVVGSTERNSAFDYNPPGSFPYPMSVTLDRHGGEASKKAVFCYKMQGGQFVQPLTGVLQAEFRGIGGTLVNPAASLIESSSNDGFDPNLGGVDGGTGGCQCAWGNFAGTVA